MIFGPLKYCGNAFAMTLSNYRRFVQYHSGLILVKRAFCMMEFEFVCSHSATRSRNGTKYFSQASN